MTRDTVNKSVLLLLVLFISAVFMSMIRSFLMAIFLAGIFSALARPLFRRLRKWFGGRQNLAALATLMVIIVVILLPLIGLLGIVTGQALKVGQMVKPWIQKQIAEPGAFSDLLVSIPFYDQLQPYRNQIIEKAGELVGSLSGYLINNLSSGAKGTVSFLFSLFILLYTMFFFLLDGKKLLEKMLYYLPLQDRDEQRMLNKFTSVTRATLKGTAVIGILQGGAAGAAFWVVGIPSALFWGTVMTVLSIIPGIGTALVWGPAAIVLAAGGHWIKGIILVLFCGLVVGSVDNVLRPRLVGKDTSMHELMIFFGTMGGILMFGVMGIIIGPIVAALFVTIWDIYGVAFADMLPAVGAALPLDDENLPTEQSATAKHNDDAAHVDNA